MADTFVRDQQGEIVREKAKDTLKLVRKVSGEGHCPSTCPVCRAKMEREGAPMLDPAKPRHDISDSRPDFSASERKRSAIDLFEDGGTKKARLGDGGSDRPTNRIRAILDPSTCG